MRGGCAREGGATHGAARLALDVGHAVVRDDLVRASVRIRVRVRVRVRVRARVRARVRVRGRGRCRKR